MCVERQKLKLIVNIMDRATLDSPNSKMTLIDQNRVYAANI